MGLDIIVGNSSFVASRAGDCGQSGAIGDDGVHCFLLGVVLQSLSGVVPDLEFSLVKRWW